MLYDRVEFGQRAVLDPAKVPPQVVHLGQLHLVKIWHNKNPFDVMKLKFFFPIFNLR